MSRAARRRQSHGLHIFLTVILVILTACVVVKAFFLKAPEQKAAELPASQPAEEENSPSDEEQAALALPSGAQGRLLYHPCLRRG